MLDKNRAPLNVVNVLSGSKSALVVLNTNIHNSGEYECQALSTDGSSASARISITVV